MFEIVGEQTVGSPTEEHVGLAQYFELLHRNNEARYITRRATMSEVQS